MKTPLLVGLVGPIASGKSTVSRWMAQRGWAILDADRVVHELYLPDGALYGPLVEAFGPGIVDAKGLIDRKALGGLVSTEPSALRTLEGLVHPVVRAHLWEAVLQARAAHIRTVLEMALLVRWPEMIAQLDAVVGITADDSVRLARLQKRNGLTEAQARDRLAFQEPPAQLLACASVIFINNDSEEALQTLLNQQLDW